MLSGPGRCLNWALSCVSFTCSLQIPSLATLLPWHVTTMCCHDVNCASAPTGQSTLILSWLLLPRRNPQPMIGRAPLAWKAIFWGSLPVVMTPDSLSHCSFPIWSPGCMYFGSEKSTLLPSSMAGSSPELQDALVFRQTRKPVPLSLTCQEHMTNSGVHQAPLTGWASTSCAFPELCVCTTHVRALFLSQINSPYISTFLSL